MFSIHSDLFRLLFHVLILFFYPFIHLSVCVTSISMCVHCICLCASIYLSVDLSVYCIGFEYIDVSLCLSSLYVYNNDPRHSWCFFWLQSLLVFNWGTIISVNEIQTLPHSSSSSTCINFATRQQIVILYVCIASSITSQRMYPPA